MRRAMVRDEIILLRQRAADRMVSATTSTSRDYQAGLDDAAADGIATLVEQAAKVSDLEARAVEIPMNPSAQRFGAPEGDTLFEQVTDMNDAFRADPYGVARTFALRSLPASAPTMAAAIVGSLAAGPGGAAVLGGLVGGGTEVGVSVAQEINSALTEANVDATDPAAVEAWISANPDALQGILDTARARAAVIGTADAVTGGVSGAIARSVAAAPKAARVAGIGAGGVVEAAGEGAGEAGAQLATTGEIDPGEVGAEVIGGLAVGAPTTAGQIVAETTRTETPTQETPMIVLVKPKKAVKALRKWGAISPRKPNRSSWP
ncbi:hypothetical protein P7F88_25500 [Vibrio hannami]|uniref:hypothetical protein n=1 Tax=Vibrio hannami TaxID=2717094 RepID=UPI00240EE461|nr:hypothetical protein [Vibrio hannami]MDG3089222.1 hypothetical protein [Vibrio hannami]